MQKNIEIEENIKIIALAGNPNVGKSTVFNGLTGLNQHTGNWAGKTVETAVGYCKSGDNNYTLIDIPGTYSLLAHSKEEQIARNLICFSNLDACIVICDACCLERNLNLVLQCMEICENVIVCVNLMDEAERKNIHIDLDTIEKRLNVPLIATNARDKLSIQTVLNSLDKMDFESGKMENQAIKVTYPEEIEKAISMLIPSIENELSAKLNPRFVALNLINPDTNFLADLSLYLGDEFMENSDILTAIAGAKKYLLEKGIDDMRLRDMVVTSLVTKAQEICTGAVSYGENSDLVDRKIDKILTHKVFSFPIMLSLLALIFWLTITGANYPSQMLASALFWFQDKLSAVFLFFNMPILLHDMLILGVYKVLAWVIAVMLPPMAIFFPLFTFLEDLGYLPRIAYNLDKPFKSCNACGKQALTMCMGFGCNAAGVVGCRIIDSPRERLLAIITNSFVPCNGRFPTLIAIVSMFFVTSTSPLFSSVSSAVLVTFCILFGILMTFFVTKILSLTLLKGEASSYTLELPPYRKPQLSKIIVRSIFDRTLFVLGRAIIVAAPAGLIIWLMANNEVGGISILAQCSNFLDPFAKLMGLDGVILLAFILGFPANEIVLPIIIMAYMAEGSLLELDSINLMRDLFIENGWTTTTALCTMLFSLVHFPCSTTILTIHKETKSLKWTVLSFAIPTVLGILSCMIVASLLNIC